MPKFHIEVLLGPDAEAVVPVKITNLDRSAQRAPTVFAARASHSAASPDLRPGRYLVQAQLPNGVVLKEEADLGDSDASLQLQLPYQSPRETLASALATRKVLSQAALVPEGRAQTQVRVLFVELWENHPEGWLAVPLSRPVDWMADDSSNAFLARVPLGGASWARALRVGGPDTPERFVMVPPYVESQVIVYSRPTDLGSPRMLQDDDGKAKANTRDPICISVVTGNSAAEGLLSYMLQGQFEAVRTVQETVARDLLMRKFVDPVGATAGAYAMLRSGSLKDIFNWLAVLADEFQLLSDAYLMIAALALGSDVPLSRLRELQAMKGVRISKKSSEQGQRETLAIHALGMAYRRGLPLYTEGLRLHRDVLDLLDFQEEGSATLPRYDLARSKILATRVLDRGQNSKAWVKGMDYFLEAGAQADWFARAVTVYSPSPNKLTRRRTFWRDPGPFAARR